MDEAVALFGRWVDSEVDKAQADVKDAAQGQKLAQAALMRCLTEQKVAEDEVAAPTPGAFRDPAEMLKKMKGG